LSIIIKLYHKVNYFVNIIREFVALAMIYVNILYNIEIYGKNQ